MKKFRNVNSRGLEKTERRREENNELKYFSRFVFTYHYTVSFGVYCYYSKYCSGKKSPLSSYLFGHTWTKVPT